jgi:hypothetical protein
MLGVLRDRAWQSAAVRQEEFERIALGGLDPNSSNDLGLAQVAAMLVAAEITHRGLVEIVEPEPLVELDQYDVDWADESPDEYSDYDDYYDHYESDDDYWDLSEPEELTPESDD